MSIKLIVGLGNPGQKYDTTRHNAGFWAVDAIAATLGGQWAEERKFKGAVTRVMVDGVDLRLLRPDTFMNRSGQSVGPLAQFFKIAPEEILVIHDELDLPPGRMRLKCGGGHGGHNGLKDIQAALGSADFWRLRIGVGHPGHRDAVVGYVLTNPPPDERRLIEDVVIEVRHLAPKLVQADDSALMQAINSYRPSA
ncbi:aminoacyl-tRNA hydrolase [Guyparkeria halophila]|uniref:Peptidyl-tRNA hydrolase n=1 Tax=Guyparkeria halophila TaxID=47960 RepID=A0ABZ0YTB6_9GAMM|nr:aminoacyl-tRNA hydrolase [Guyparkeria halophila]WQH15415.1 aminoacyl-tRNA hydrolase [Guyparkeria halophila]